MKPQPCTRRHFVVATSSLLLVLASPLAGCANYQNFDVAIRQLLGRELFVRFDAHIQASLFVYDNIKFIVESFRETPVPNARVITGPRITKLNNLLTGEVLTGTAPGSTTVFNTPLTPGSYRVFAAE